MHRDPGALMVFAAGFGTRMGALTAARPKPLLDLGGRSLLDRALALGEAAAVPKIVVNAHYHAPQVEAAVAGRNVAVSTEMPDILDTGGGLKKAGPLLGARVVFTLNPDVLFLGPNPLAFLRDAWPEHDTSALLLLVAPQGAEMRRGGGDFALGDDGRLSRSGPLIYTGAQVVDIDGLAAFGDGAFSLNAYWDRLAEEGRLHGVVYPGRWCDVGTPEALAHAERLVAEAGNE